MSSTAHREVLGLQVRHLAELPVPTTVVLLSPAPLGHWYCTTSRPTAAALIEVGEVVCTPLEYELLAVTLADGRRSPAEAAQELASKRGRSSCRLERRRLLGPVRRPDVDGYRWTWRQLLGVMGAELVSVRLDGMDAWAPDAREVA